MKRVFGYTRVSTIKQVEGVSLEEQQEAIIRYAEKHNLKIIEWFEETVTAAKQGRPMFTKMINLLQGGKSSGVIIHKIDRSTRNLKDWAALGDLIDQGVEIHFAHESLDMDTRGGRLAADIQAVIASDYIRNLRQEVTKGIYGRLKQGIYPFLAPIGYINNGKGNHKTIHPIKGPLVKKAFTLYASGKYSLDSLTIYMNNLGLTNSRGNKISVNTMSKILNNPFYAGVLRVKSKTFTGGHEPLISANTFKEVKNVLSGKCNSKEIKHNFIFRRSLKCAECKYSLIGERQKGKVYYRCHTKTCITKSVREDVVEKKFLDSLIKLQLHDVEHQILDELIKEAQLNWERNEKGFEDALRMQQEKLNNKLERLTDAYTENVIDKSLFDKKKESILIDLQGLRKNRSSFHEQKLLFFKRANNFLELLKSFKQTYISGIHEEKRQIMKILTSNLVIQGKNIIIPMRIPFDEIANRHLLTSCAHERHTPRTCTVDIATVASSGDNVIDYVADLAIDPVTKQVDFSNSVPILSQTEVTPQLRENMKQLLDMILEFFQDELTKLENGELKEEDMLLSPYVQEDDSSTKFNTRRLPPHFKQRRA